MYNFVKFISAIAASAVLLASCAGRVSIGYEDKSYSTDSICVKAQIPQIDGLASRDLQDKINEEYRSVCGEALREFQAAAEETKEQSVFETETAEHFNRGGFLSVVTRIDSCPKKNRRSSMRLVKNINTAACTEVSLSGLFADDAYIDVLNERLAQEIGKNPERYADLWEKPRLAQGQRYYIDGENLVIFYPPYELSYYERGFVEIPVKLSEISGYLKPEYREMLLG